MIQEILEKIIKEVVQDSSLKVDIQKTENESFGDYSTNIAFALAKKLGKSPQEVAEELVGKLDGAKPSEVKDVKALGGYVNFFLSETFLHQELAKIAKIENFGAGESLKGETIMLEYTDPNPFKEFHIGHLMSNIIGESLARLHEASGAKVLRVNWQGDIGLHIAMAIWGIKKGYDFLGEAYVVGSKAYTEDTSTKAEIEEINKKLYDQSDLEINKLYKEGRQGSLDYFETVYKKLGTKFDHYFFESELGPEGLKIVKDHPEIFEESQGATVFKGEKYGLHTRVFINSQGLPTYEAKELGLNQEKFKLYKPNKSFIVTGNEIIGYFKVLIKVMELTMPDVASKTRHVPHGMLRLPSGKMSSRTGNVITAESLIDEVKKIIKGKATTELGDESIEAIAVGAIKYSILKQGIGHDIVFDFNKSLSFQGDSGPYLQYTYARLISILSKAGEVSGDVDFGLLIHPDELGIIKNLIEFPNSIKESNDRLAPHHLATYILLLANKINHYYEAVRILQDENVQNRNVRLTLIKTASSIIKAGLNLLGIKTVDRI